MYCVCGHAGADYADQGRRKKRKEKGSKTNSGMKASPSEIVKIPNSAAGGAAARDAEADALPTSTKAEKKKKKKQQQKSQSDLTAPQLGLLHVVPLPPCIPCHSKEGRSSQAASSSCVTGLPPSLDDVPTPGSDAEDDKLKEVRKAPAIHI